MMHTRSDAELLRAADRDPQAFRHLYDRHCTSLYEFFARRTGDHHGALDLTAETFAQAWASRRRFADERGGTAGPWLFGIARNVLLRSVRQRRMADEACTKLGLQRTTAPSLEPEPAWLEGLDDDIARALDELPEDQRRAIELRVLHDQTYETVAAVQDCAPATARVRVFRGLRTVRTTVKGTNR
jgi:RNA polymerase sigma-70 factor (ECF subfamily)